MRRIVVLSVMCCIAIATLAATFTVTPASAGAADSGQTVTLVTHDSFAVSEKVLAAFTKRTGIDVKVLQVGDAGQVVNQAILTKDNPLGDVLFGVDNTFLTRALDEGIFERYRSPALADVATDLQLDPKDRVTPVDYGDVCINYDKDWFASHEARGAEDARRPHQAEVRGPARGRGPVDVVARARVPPRHRRRVRRAGLDEVLGAAAGQRRADRRRLGAGVLRRVHRRRRGRRAAAGRVVRVEPGSRGGVRRPAHRQVADRHDDGLVLPPGGVRGRSSREPSTAAEARDARRLPALRRVPVRRARCRCSSTRRRTALPCRRCSRRTPTP